MFLSYDMDMEFGNIIHIPLKTLQDPSLRRRNEVKPRSRPTLHLLRMEDLEAASLAAKPRQGRTSNRSWKQCGKGCGHWLRTLEMNFLVTTTSDFAKSKYIIYIYLVFPKWKVQLLNRKREDVWFLWGFQNQQNPEMGLFENRLTRKSHGIILTFSLSMAIPGSKTHLDCLEGETRQRFTHVVHSCNLGNVWTCNNLES